MRRSPGSAGACPAGGGAAAPVAGQPAFGMLSHDGERLLPLRAERLWRVVRLQCVLGSSGGGDLASLHPVGQCRGGTSTSSISSASARTAASSRGHRLHRRRPAGCRGAPCPHGDPRVGEPPGRGEPGLAARSGLTGRRGRPPRGAGQDGAGVGRVPSPILPGPPAGRSRPRGRGPGRWPRPRRRRGTSAAPPPPAWRWSRRCRGRSPGRPGRRRAAACPDARRAVRGVLAVRSRARGPRLVRVTCRCTSGSWPPAARPAPGAASRSSSPAGGAATTRRRAPTWRTACGMTGRVALPGDDPAAASSRLDDRGPLRGRGQDQHDAGRAAAPGQPLAVPHQGLGPVRAAHCDQDVLRLPLPRAPGAGRVPATSRRPTSRSAASRGVSKSVASAS